MYISSRQPSSLHTGRYRMRGSEPTSLPLEVLTRLPQPRTDCNAHGRGISVGTHGGHHEAPDPYAQCSHGASPARKRCSRCLKVRYARDDIIPLTP